MSGDPEGRHVPGAPTRTAPPVSTRGGGSGRPTPTGPTATKGGVAGSARGGVARCRHDGDSCPIVTRGSPSARASTGGPVPSVRVSPATVTGVRSLGTGTATVVSGGPRGSDSATTRASPPAAPPVPSTGRRVGDPSGAVSTSCPTRTCAVTGGDGPGVSRVRRRRVPTRSPGRRATRQGTDVRRRPVSVPSGFTGGRPDRSPRRYCSATASPCPGPLVPPALGRSSRPPAVPVAARRSVAPVVPRTPVGPAPPTGHLSLRPDVVQECQYRAPGDVLPTPTCASRGAKQSVWSPSEGCHEHCSCPSCQRLSPCVPLSCVRFWTVCPSSPTRPSLLLLRVEHGSRVRSRRG